jgi:uncharacterized protein (TIGR02246 family)
VAAEETMTKPTDADTIRALERDWSAAIQRRDVERMADFLADEFFLVIGVERQPLQIFPRQQWLATLPGYVIDSMEIGDIRVRVYGDVAVAAVACQQRAYAKGLGDRTGHFLLTDTWVRTDGKWRVTERHSARAGPLLQQLGSR